MAPRKPDQEFVQEGASQITGADVEKVIDKAEDIRKKFNPGGPLGRFIEDGRLLVALVKDYWSREYRQIPYATIAAAVFSLLYVFNPLDFMPDILPIIGQIDDSMVVGACLLLVEQDLRAYKRWKLGPETSQ